MGILKEKMIISMTLRGFADATKKTYLNEIKQLTKYYKRSPDTLRSEDIINYLLYLMKYRKCSPSKIRVCHQACRFFYEKTLNRPAIMNSIPLPKGRRRLPVILDREELNIIFEHAHLQKHKAILMLAYSAGLRVCEVCMLRVADIDSKRMQVRVFQSKGQKDRYTILSKIALEELRKY
jgi:site-specific recombinase XerD